MKKYLFVVLITILFVPNLFGSIKQYEEALNLYNLKEYKKAYDMFIKLAQIEESTRLNFYLGRSAYEIGKYNEALEFYGKVLFDAPENLRVRLEIAQTHLQLGDKEKAKAELTYLLSEEIPTNIKQYIQNSLKTLDSSKDYILKNSVFFGLGYNDNIKSTTSNSYSIYIPQLNQNFNISPEDKVSGGSYEFGIISNYIKKLQDNFLFNLNVVGLSQNYFSNELHNNQMQLFSFGITPIFIQKDSQIAIKFSYEHFWYGHQNYLDSFTIAPRFSKKISENYLNTTTFKFAYKGFVQTANNYGNSNGSVIDDTQKDSRTFELSNRLTHFSKTTGTSSLEIALGKESDLDNVRVDIDKRYAMLGFSNIYPISNKVSLNSGLQYKKTKYDNYDQNFQTYRADSTYTVSLGVKYKLTQSTQLSLAYRHINRISNFSAYDYNKNIIKSNINYRF